MPTRKAAKRTPKKSPAARSATSKKSATKRPAKNTATFKKAKDVANANGVVESRSDFGQHGSVAINRLPEPKLAIAKALDRLIRSVVPNADSVVKWGNACYLIPREPKPLIFASIMETKAGLNLALAGANLPDPDGLLEGTGKSMRHVKFKTVADAGRPALKDLIKQSAEIGLMGM